ncbi:MAG: hypothetical protein ACR2FN_12445 [Chitinophagaceae bacterium]
MKEDAKKSTELNEEKNNDSSEKFPGYPHYPAKEDILNPQNHTKRVDANVENFTRQTLSMQSLESKETPKDAARNEDVENLEIVPGTEADVTQDDLVGLETIDKQMQGEDVDESESDASASAFSATEETVADLDEKDLANELKRTGDDLDVPGEELDDANEEIGEEDEENNYYSLGGDENENLEEDPTAQGY